MAPIYSDRLLATMIVPYWPASALIGTHNVARFVPIDYARLAPVGLKLALIPNNELGPMGSIIL